VAWRKSDLPQRTPRARPAGNGRDPEAVSSVKSSPTVRRIPWARIVFVLAAAMLAAWAVGFFAGLIVRFFVPHPAWLNRV
jgi:hypothetical protein